MASQHWALQHWAVPESLVALQYWVVPGSPAPKSAAACHLDARRSGVNWRARPEHGVLRHGHWPIADRPGRASGSCGGKEDGCFRGRQASNRQGAQGGLLGGGCGHEQEGCVFPKHR